MRTGKSVTIAIALLMLAALPVTTHAQPRVRFELELGTSPWNGYYGSLSEDYNVPYHDICVMHDAGVADEDMPTILYIYTHSQYSLRQIYSLRLNGATWENLSNWCGVPLYRDRSGPPYGNAYGYYQHGPGRTWYAPGEGRGVNRDHDGQWRNDEHGRGRYHGHHEDDDGD